MYELLMGKCKMALSLCNVVWQFLTKLSMHHLQQYIQNWVIN
jgi:hypothetical protein